MKIIINFLIVFIFCSISACTDNVAKKSDRVYSKASVLNNSVYYNNVNTIFEIDKEEGNLLTSIKLNSEITSKLIISDGVAYFGSFNGRAYAINLENQSEKWNFKTDTGIYSCSMFDDVIYIGSGRKLIALNAENGGELWAFQLDEQAEPIFKDDITHSSAIVSNGLVIFGAEDKKLYALDKATGLKEWVVELNDEIDNDVVVDDGVIYVSDFNGYLYAIEILSGEIIWKHKPSYWYSPSPVTANGIVYHASEYSDDNTGRIGVLQALAAETADVKWSFTAAGGIPNTPTISNGTIYFGTWYGQVYALDSVTGIEKWKYEGEKALLSSPVVTDTTVYFSSDFCAEGECLGGTNSSGGVLLALDSITGAEKWTVKQN